ncbi:hypothetical protein HFP89_08525 [Wenzhouxiangella sp. XN79A]|uniref:winged helix-turn-helix domain-containing protein n=1 Tax=Wenzhouxiangella sp. XN79A TaxID=2724193 RepID=UPI00144AD21A|nr:winged helix-turn-helix domain-containing protein [Wenzhouxiangella sp. XN79A]NKI35210.1 hypothetical protein [Wenzhouxiangella sp. XN79A]
MAITEFEGLRYDSADGTLRAVGGEPLTLRPQLARLLETFLDRPGEVLDRPTLCAAVWGEDRVVDFEAGLAALIKELRQALRSLGASDELLETVPRRGYRFHASIEPGRAAGDAPPARDPVARRLPTVIAIFTGLWLVTVVLWSAFAPDPGPESSPRLAVVPFELLGDVGPDNLDLVLADTLLAALWQAELDGVVLLGRTSIGADLSGRARAGFVARELDASLILEGSLIVGTNSGEAGWRVEARLLRLPRGEVAWTATVDGRTGPAIPVGEVAAALADDLARHWPGILAR